MVFLDRPIGQVSRVFANGTADQDIIPDRVTTKTKKKRLIPLCLILSFMSFVSRVTWSNPEKGVVPTPTPRCSSYRKGSLRVALENCQLSLTKINFGLESLFAIFHFISPYFSSLLFAFGLNVALR